MGGDHQSLLSSRTRIELCAFAVFAALHLPGAVVATVALTRPGTTTAAALTGGLSVFVSLALWTALAAAAWRGLRRRAHVSRGLLALALALDAVVLTISGLSPPRPGNIAAAAVGVLALCAAAGLLTRPRLLPVVLVPAVSGQVVLLRAADATASPARLVADVATVAAAGVAIAVLIAWLEHERRRAQAALTSAALRDPMTGLLNRRGLAEGVPGLLLPVEPARGRRPWRRPGPGSGTVQPAQSPAQSPARSPARSPAPAAESAQVVVIVLDVDHFKGVNDRRGHDVGDAVLIEVAGALRDCSREQDLLVRLGGEELAWVAVWPGTREALLAAERLRALVVERTQQLGEPVTVSAGVAGLPAAAAPGDPVTAASAAAAVSDALTRADRALYRAKARGRDRTEVADDDQTLNAAISGARSRPPGSADHDVATAHRLGGSPGRSG